MTEASEGVQCMQCDDTDCIHEWVSPSGDHVGFCDCCYSFGEADIDFKTMPQCMKCFTFLVKYEYADHRCLNCTECNSTMMVEE